MTQKQSDMFKVPRFETDPAYVTRCLIFIALGFILAFRYWPTDADVEVENILDKLYHTELNTKEHDALLARLRVVGKAPALSRFQRGLVKSVFAKPSELPPLNEETDLPVLASLITRFTVRREPALLKQICALRLDNKHYHKEVSHVGHTIAAAFGKFCGPKDTAIFAKYKDDYHGPKTAVKLA